MATFEQRESGWWQAKIRRKGLPVQSKTFEKKSDAEMWARDVENKMDRGVFVDRAEAEKTSLHDALERYEREISSTKKSKKHEGYRIGQLKKLDLAKRPLASLKSTDFAKYRDDRLKEVSPATTRLDLALFSNLFTIAGKDWNMGIANPILLVTLPKISNARDRRFLEGEETKLMAELDKCKNTWVKPLVIVALETGARMGELRKLQWQNVDLAKGTAKLYDTKNSDDRVIPLSSKAIAVLKGLPRDIGGLIFPVSKDSVSHAFSLACERAGLGDFRFHDLRHEAVSRLFEKGFELMEVASISGHKTLSMLQRYTHMQAQKLAKKLG